MKVFLIVKLSWHRRIRIKNIICRHDKSKTMCLVLFIELDVYLKLSIKVKNANMIIELIFIPDHEIFVKIGGDHGAN